MANRKPLTIARIADLTSVLALTGILSIAQAGVVTSTTANMPHNPVGFGAWNLDNITVTVNGGGTYSEADGSYTIGDGTFDSFVDDGTGTQSGVVHGKDWPVGEPSGIKVINDDLAVKEGKPTNCLMTTSYLELADNVDAGYLDTATPVQVLCSSGFQTHKRFKVNMEPNSLAPGEPIDLVFNIEPDAVSATRDYQVFQKINNYTDKRLEGFRVEVGTGVGSQFQTASSAGLTANLWLSIPPAIWDAEDVATFSHGLFGPADKHFPEDGFFDSQRAGFFTAVTEYDPVNNPGIGDEFHSTTTQGSNYAQVPPTTGPVTQFGPWLPSIWVPQGIFFDDDDDATTDALLMAFWGETANASGVFAWMQGDADGFAAVDPATLDLWKEDPLYSVDRIEDLLNVGLNYIVTIGTVDDTWPTWDGATSTATFTIRMIPAEDTSGIGEPTYVANPPPPFAPASAQGSVSITPSPTFVISTPLLISAADSDLNVSDVVVETVDVDVANLTNGETETLTLTETAADRGVFEATMNTAFGAAPNATAGIVNVLPGEVVEVTYVDADDGLGGVNVPVTATSTAAAGNTGVLTVTASIDPGDNLSISLADADLNTRSDAVDFATVDVVNDVTGESELISLEETGFDTGVFAKPLTTQPGAAAGANNDAVMNVQATDTLTTTYLDAVDNTGAPATVTAATTVNSNIGLLTVTADINPGDTLSISLTDTDLNVNNSVIDVATVTVVNDITGESELVTMNETGVNTGVFVQTLTTLSGTTAGTDNDGSINVQAGDTLTTTYLDAADNAGAPATVTAATTVTAAPSTSSSSSSSGGSSGCSLAGPDANFNPTMPLLMALVIVFGVRNHRRQG